MPLLVELARSGYTAFGWTTVASPGRGQQDHDLPALARPGGDDRKLSGPDADALREIPLPDTGSSRPISSRHSRDDSPSVEGRGPSLGAAHRRAISPDVASIIGDVVAERPRGVEVDGHAQHRPGELTREPTRSPLDLSARSSIRAGPRSGGHGLADLAVADCHRRAPAPDARARSRTRPVTGHHAAASAVLMDAALKIRWAPLPRGDDAPDCRRARGMIRPSADL